MREEFGAYCVVLTRSGYNKIQYKIGCNALSSDITRGRLNFIICTEWHHNLYAHIP